ncbi:MAG TPA: FHA domain-containing protein [Pirellulales bacterium]|nr:FHA domain-containing protein [Pirellulales bacterium]
MLTLLNEPRLLPVPGFVLGDGCFVCGRSAKAELIVPHETVSRRHAELQVAGTCVKVVDLNSRNGTFIDGQRIESAELRPSQVLALGAVSFVLVEGERSLDDLEPSGDLMSTRRTAAPQQADTEFLQLSEAQRRVLDLALAGLVEKQIARRLNISRHTAHNHLRNIYRILDVHSRAELLAQLLSRKK